MSDSEHAHVKRKASVSRDEKAWEAEVKAEILADELEMYRTQALKEIQKNATIAGFRPGHAPESEIVRVYGEQPILRRAAEMAIQHALPEILAAEKLPIVETPRVTTEPPESGKQLSFIARAALAPEIELPDYKAIAKKFPKSAEPPTVSDEEHAQALTHLKRERTRIEFVEKGKNPAEAAEEARKMEEKDLPALDDEFAKSIGYETADAFHKTVRENMQTEKTRVEAEKRRASILDELLKETAIRYPIMLREYELDDIEARLSHDLSRAGSSMEALLNDAKKTREQLREEWKDAADKRARTRLILSEIARKEGIGPRSEDVARELESAKKYVKDANEGSLRAHIAHAMRNEATLQFLESVT